MTADSIPRRSEGLSIHSETHVPEALYASITESVRRLVDATIRSQADLDTLLSAKAKIDAAASELSQSLIPASFGVQQAVDGRSLAWGNAVIGLRNAVAPPLVVHHESDGRVWADVTLGAAYEGPAGHVHGGICALLLDHVLGATAHKPGAAGRDRHSYPPLRSGTRLGPVRAEAHIDRVEGVKTFAVGHLATPDGITVRAEGVFFHPRRPAG